ncbi:unnamed protein product [Hymenolepis diminuta]|uniref:RING-type domain-containing protein n=1 Tax=Hymenolepis diminuta TaxID=6216 RepID=A0A564Z4F5_HYMDI|nr:unnamed protein product [Hymenolepis diminuta]
MESIKCCICQEGIRQPIAKPDCCLHLFCRECLLKWLKQRNTCPLDRYTVRLINIMNNLDGPVIEAVSIPTTSKAMSSYELLRPLLLSDSEDELEFTMPHTIEDLVIKMKDISDELHDKLSRLLNFNGSIRRYLISDMSIEARFYQISETLMHSKVLLDGETPATMFNLSPESQQICDELLSNCNNYLIKYFIECSKKFGIRLRDLPNRNESSPLMFSDLVNITYTYVTDFFHFFSSG